VKRKVLVVGLDCATPQFVFEAWREELPHLRALQESGVYGRLESTKPPITVPAWMSMLTSRDPGQLGVYGFRNRKDYSYDALYFANASVIRDKTVYDILGEAGLRSVILGVPQTYPPRPINGILVASFLTPDKSCDYTYPRQVKEELEKVAGGYMIDVEGFRTENKDWLLEQIYQMTEKRFRAVQHYLQQVEWDFFFFVEMGVDRLHHGFWRFGAPEHRLYEPGNKYEHAIRDYYRYIDGKIGELLELLPPEAVVLVVSDYGAKTMVGGIAVNEWLQEQGYLKLKEQPKEQVRLTSGMIDWSRTLAWGEGGYYSRIFLNVRGREPQGLIPPEQYEAVREELIARLEAIEDENGRNIGTRVFRPEEIYRECRNIPPDLVVYFGNLDWRSVGSVGLGRIHVFENDTGPDDANHAEEGIFIMTEMKRLRAGARLGREVRASIYDVAPTLLRLYGVPVPEGMIGKALDGELLFG